MNNVIQVRYNNRTELIPFDKNKKIDDYINARRKLWDLIKDKKNNIRIKQRPGDMLILDNYRVLHGRVHIEILKIVATLRQEATWIEIFFRAN